jgi:quercetin dioxygenase-like cupin family protein
MTDFNVGFAAAGVQLVHNYAKETHIPAGCSLSQHVHPFDHKSILESGRVRVTADGVSRIYEGPAALVIKAGVQHQVEALTDAVWFCIWPMGIEDDSGLDEAIVRGNFKVTA